ncbi:hypothetical protein MHBO_002348 [Bonamia ostreae]|uniref:Acylamino-acid-releasing enzyme N-terminal domain-containing protein n=1 Tax=Bonamia ostreae TaxID=126728 RepID=A0ABV2AM44_9EUKA
MKKCTVARATQLWKELLKVPSKTAQFVGKETVVVSTNVPDISSNKTRKRLNFFSNSILTEKQKFVPIGFPVDTSSEMSCYSVSPSGNRLCVVRKHPSKEKVQVIDILSKEKLLFTTSFPNLFSF